MRARPTPSGSRPSGTDGSDFAFRMTVDNRYKRVAEKKFQLQKLLNAETVFQLLKALSATWLAVSGQHVDSITIAACIFGGAALLAGTIGLRRSSSTYLNIFMFTSSAAAMLSVIPFLSGHYYSKVTGSWGNYLTSGNYKPILIDGLEAAQEIVGVIVQLVGLSVTLSLLQLLSRGRGS